MKGFGLLETIVALGIFSVISVAGISGFIPALQSGRSGREQTQAVNLAQEGLEAIRSIRERDYANLTPGTFGIGISSNLWSLSGTSDVNDKYTRKIIISQASRDTGGSLVSSGGVTDPDTFIVTSNISWNNSIGDTRQISLDSVLTNWRKSIGGVNYNGLIVYGSGNTNTPFWRTYTSSSNIFSAQTSMPSLIGSPRNFIIRTSPTKTESIVGIGTSAGVLYVYCFDGTNWTQDWSATIGGNATTRRFDIAYENASGNAVVLYSTNTASTNELNFRKKLGTDSCGSANWTTATAFDPIRTSDVISWIKMYSNPTTGSNLIATTWVDWNKDLSGAIWNGTTFTNEMTSVGETKIEAINTGVSYPDVESFDLAYESVSGDLMIIWGTSLGANGTNGVRYRTCTGNIAACTWSAVTTPATFSDDATNLDLSANPNSDEMVFSSIGNAGADLQIGYWSGTAWTNRANVDTSSGAPLAGTKLVANGWLTSGSTTRYVVQYTDSTGNGVSWYVGLSTSAPVVQTDYTTATLIGYPKKWIEIQQNPIDKSQLMSVISDTNSDLFARRLTMNVGASFSWSEADGGSALQTNLSQATVKPFGFTYWQQ